MRQRFTWWAVLSGVIAAAALCFGGNVLATSPINPLCQAANPTTPAKANVVAAIPQVVIPIPIACATGGIKTTATTSNTTAATLSRNLNAFPIHPNSFPKKDVPLGSMWLIGSFPQYAYRFSVWGAVRLAAFIPIGSTCVNRPCGLLYNRFTA